MIWDYIMVFGGYAAVIWWAYTADFSVCDECYHDCEQGKRCHERSDD